MGIHLGQFMTMTEVDNTDESVSEGWGLSESTQDEILASDSEDGASGISQEGR